MSTELFPCPCCGYKVFSEPCDGTFDICDICGWEDDNVQLADPDYAGGANYVSLKQVQRNFLAFGASTKERLKYTRQPTSDDERVENWKPLE